MNAIDISCDLETQSECDLKLGVHAYAAHGSTNILCMAYGNPGDTPAVWKEGEPFPPVLREHVASGGRLRAWNASFERSMFSICATKKYGWPEIPLRQWVCTMAEALAMGLPGALKDAAPAVSLPISKDLVGSRIMMQLCKPRPSDGKLWRPGMPGADGKFQVLYDYCAQDVVVEMAIAERIRRLIPKEQELYHLTERINDTGVWIDAALCSAAQKLIDEATTRLTAEMRRVSNFEIAGPNAVAQISAWLRGKGLDVTSLDKDHIAGFLLRDDLTPEMRRVLEIRQDAAKTSTSKIATMMNRRGVDGRVRGMFRYHGATTGRYSVAGLQLQNYPRPDPSIDIDAAIADVLEGDFDMVEAMHGPALNVVSTLLRSCISAPPGRTLVSADLSQIELRMNAYLSGQDDAVEGFRLYDRGEGPDAYVVSAAGIYGIPIDQVSKDLHRPVGKVAELALGFLGGAGALMKMAKNSRVDLRKVAGSVMDAATYANTLKAEQAWIDRGIKSGSSEIAWTTAELIKLAWRDAHPAIVAYAYALEETAKQAMREPNVWHACGYVKYRKSGSFLCCKLPSGRVIYYPSAHMGDALTPWGASKRAVKAKHKNIANQWVDRALTPGILIENVVQAASRDVMTDAMHVIDAHYPEYDATLSIHDELVAEAYLSLAGTVKTCNSDLDVMTSILATPPAWLPGLPLAAAGWEGERFRK